MIEINYSQMKYFEIVNRISELVFAHNATATGISIVNVESPFLLFLINNNEITYDYWEFKSTDIVELIVLSFLKGEYIYQTKNNEVELQSLVWNNSKLQKYNLGSLQDSKKEKGFKFFAVQN